jgi:hypothetical protein
MLRLINCLSRSRRAFLSPLLECELNTVQGGMSLDAFCSVRAAQYKLSKIGVDFISLTKFLECWWEWLRRRSVHSDTLFACPTCSQKPIEEWRLTWDAMSIGIKWTKMTSEQPNACTLAQQRGGKPR